MAIPTLGAMIAAMGSPTAEWGAVDTANLSWDDTDKKLSISHSGIRPQLLIANTAENGKAWTLNAYTDGSFYIGHLDVINAVRFYPTTGNAEFIADVSALTFTDRP